ncbi:ABC transporter permease subunit [Pannus brasiliensis CCIBt3594]|uniref:ABC transporter permease subunit n=1 Tax=Pannus brasiliensis CCIBt3594 TaxID=1427578 RepID=A0AAW9QZ06_9CHRO
MIKIWRSRRGRTLLLGLLGWMLAIGFSVIPAFSQSPPNPFKVATEATFPPFEFQNNKTGQIEGFDVDLIKAIGEKAGLTIELVNLPFDGIIPALQSGSVQAAISGMTITPERARAIDFSRPYFKAGLAIAVQENNDTIKSFEDLKDKRIAVQIGTTGAAEAKKVPGAKITTFDNAVLALQELVNGNVDAVVNDGPVTLYAIKDAGLKGVKIVGQLLTEEYYGIALAKNSPYVQLINDGLAKLIESGQYDVIYRKWFAAKPPELPLVAPSLESGTENAFSWRQVFYNLIVLGVPVTLILTSLSFFFGLIGGTLVAIALISPYNWLRLLCRIYVDFFRGTPMLVQLFIIYFGLPNLIKEIGLSFTIDRLPAAILALSLNVAAYLAEIMRGGIQSVDKGQWEACESLGMSPLQTMKDVIFPQAFRRMLPPLGNEFITLIKDTSLAAVIGFEELFRQGQLIVATTYKAFEIYIAVALIYLILTTLSSFGFKWLEQYMDPIGRAAKKGKV